MRVPKSPPDWMEAISGSTADDIRLVFEKFRSPEVVEFVRRANHNYLHWDKLRHHPMPEGVSAKEMWAAVVMSRSQQLQPLPLSFNDLDSQLKYWTTPHHQEWLHRIDQDAGGLIGSRSRLLPRDDDDRFLFNSLMEEAIASSQLEGATTTREIAKMMLRTGRKPRDHHEQMILNNYNAILEIRELKNDPLTPELLCHIQNVITDRTLQNPESAGRFRTKDDPPVCVVDATTNEVLHNPPSVNSIQYRVEELCDFANDDPKTFIHPVVKAIALHFTLGYIHPFVDGNGRTARALFYWFMLKKGYWVFEYLPISRIVLDTPVKYARAYLYAETDAGDLTYFIHYHLRIIDRAVREMHEYFVKQQALMRQARQAVANIPGLNHRQIAVAYDAIQNPSATFTIKQHAGTTSVQPATARADLLGLEACGILQKTFDGKRWVFSPAAHLKKKLQKGAFRESTSRQSVRPAAARSASPAITDDSALDEDEAQLSPLAGQKQLF